VKIKLFLGIFLTNVVLLAFSQTNNYADGNGTIIETRDDGNITWVFRKHNQHIRIGNLSRDENLIIYDRPVLENGVVIGKLKLDDSINITQVAETIVADDYYFWANISTENNITGWIFCGKYDYASVLPKLNLPKIDQANKVVYQRPKEQGNGEKETVYRGREGADPPGNVGGRQAGEPGSRGARRSPESDSELAETVVRGSAEDLRGQAA
jgi:hypothetical protein